MNKEITVDKAIREWRGLSVIIILVMGITWIAGIAIFSYFPLWLSLILFFSGVAIEWLLYFFAYNRWIIWAFTNVQNVHELRKRTEVEHIISANNKFYKKVETDEKYKNIRLKFSQDVIFTDDKTISEETIIYFSKTLNIFYLVLYFFLLLFGLFMLFVPDTADSTSTLRIFGGLFSLSAIFGISKETTKLKKGEPQLILSNKGIKSKTTFHKWEEIEDERMHIYPGTKGSTKIYLTYRHPRGKERIDVTDLSVKEGLGKLLVLYRERSKLKK